MSMNLQDCGVARSGFPRPVPSTPANVMEQLKLTNKVCVVTGASEGIGLAVAEAFAEAGAQGVALCYNSNDAAVAKAEELAKVHAGVKTKAYKVDVSDAEQVKRTVAEIERDFGRIDVFVSNAGMSISKPILEQTVEEYKKQLSVNVDGNFFCAKYVGEVFKRQGSGNLIVTSSISAHIVNVPVDQPVYNGSKAFVSHFAKSVAREWRDFARVNVVSPGFFDTKMGAGHPHEAYRMTPLGRQGHVKEIKGLYLYLASDASTYTTGSEMIVDGGYVLP